MPADVAVVGPDGKHYKFPDGTTHEQAVDFFRKQSGGSSTSHTSHGAGGSWTPPTFGERFREAVGVPSIDQAKRELTDPATSPLLGPLNQPIRAYKMLHELGTDLSEGAQQAYRGVKEGVEDYRAGAPLGSSLAVAGGAALEGTLRGPLSPFGGKSALAAASDFERGNTTGAAGSIAGLLTNLLLAKYSEGRSPESKANRLTYASTGGEALSGADYRKAYKQALPELEKTAKLQGKSPASLSDLGTLVQDTFTRTENEFAQHLQPIAAQQTVPQRISTAIRSEKIPNPKRAQDIAWNTELEHAAVEFDQPYSLRELNQQRMLATDRLHPQFGKAESAQAAVSNTRAQIAVDRAIEDGARDILYNALDSHYQGQLPQGYFRELKRTQSAMYDIKDQVNSQANKLSNKSSLPALERAGTNLFTTTSGRVGFNIHRLPKLFETAEGRASRSVRSAEVGDVPTATHSAVKAFAETLPVRQLPTLAAQRDAQPKPEAMSATELGKFIHSAQFNDLSPSERGKYYTALSRQRKAQQSLSGRP